jgi:hypothetical protein
VRLPDAARLLLLPLWLAVGQVWAAGGAHIIDDSDVVPPGVCHLETWGSLFLPNNGYYNLGPACTFESLPMVQAGLQFQHYWDESISGGVLFGPQFKVTLRPESTGFGIGVGLVAGVNLHTGDLGVASIVGLFTLPINEKVRLNLNAGWSFVRDVESPNALFYGAQFDAKLGFDLSLMIEMFARTRGTAGAQFGLRYTPGDGPVDIDLLVGSTFAVENVRFLTLGVTVRF